MEKKMINFEEVIYSSSQKSIISGMSGFHVRTHSANVDTDLIDTLAKNDFFSYELSSDRMVSMEQLQDNPKIVYEYPESFVYKKICLENGKQKYVISRTVYIGIDYGYFCNGEHRRTGSNFFAHVLVFDEQPPKEIFKIIVENNAFNNNVFLPLDYTCSPNNRELTRLLTGEPQLMPSNSFDIASYNRASFHLREELGMVAAGVLQLYINRKNKTENGNQLIVKATKEITKEIINFIKNFIPQTMSSQLTFVSNYVREGMPDDFDIVFVNEFYNGTLYEEQHICIDLLNGNHTGMEKNLLLDKITNLAKEGDEKTLSSLLEYISSINIQHDSDYEFLYKIFILTKSDKEISLTDLSSDFIEKLSKANLSGGNKQIVWNKINTIINSCIMSKNGQDIIKTLSLLAIIKQYGFDKEINITSSGKEYFTRILFDTNENFGRIVKSNNISTVLPIISPTIIQTSDRLFNSLQTSDSKEVWKAFISICFSGNDKLAANSGLIITKVADSPMPLESRKELMLQLFPVSGNGEQIFFNYFMANPDAINKYPDILNLICKKKPAEYYPKLLSETQGNQAAFNLITSSLQQLFKEKTDHKENISSVLDTFLTIANNTPKEILVKVDFNSLLKTFTDMMLDNPAEKYKNQVDELLESGLKIKQDNLSVFKAIQSILKNESAEESNVKTISFAYKLSKKDIIEEMFSNWMKRGFSKRDLVDFINSNNGLRNTPQFISYMIISIWNSSVNNINANRKDLVETIIDNAKWSKDDFNKFIKSDKPEDLTAFITKSNGFFNKLLRKLFNK